LPSSKVDAPGGQTPPDIVAIFNTSPDAVELVRSVLQIAGIVVVSAFTWEIRVGHVDIDAFMDAHHPRVVVYDIAPPYDENWNLFRHIRSLDAMEGVEFVITSTNANYVQGLARDERILEIIGKPFDLDQIVRAVKEALRARPTR
jgi:DNA-binding NtrC family response regulator